MQPVQINEGRSRIEDYDVYNWKHILGEGASATVFQARELKSGTEVAIKRIDKSKKNKSVLICVRREVEIQSRLDHPSLVKLYDHFEDKRFVYIILELCHKGELQSFMENERAGEPFSEEEARQIFKQVLDGVEYLHSKDIMHRDLKLSNILITEDGNIKISDFGLAVFVNDSYRTLCGTPNFMSPETVTQSDDQTTQSDVWSLGCLLYNLLVGRPPFEGKNTKETLAKIRASKFYIPSDLSDEATNLIKALLKGDRKSRIPVKAILRHPFLQKTNLRSSNWCRIYGSVDSGIQSLCSSTTTRSSSGLRTYSSLDSRSFGSSDTGKYSGSKGPYSSYDENSLPSSKKMPAVLGKLPTVRSERLKMVKPNIFCELRKKFSPPSSFNPAAALTDKSDLVAEEVGMHCQSAAGHNLNHKCCGERDDCASHPYQCNADPSQNDTCCGFTLENKPCCSQSKEIHNFDSEHCPRYNSDTCSVNRESTNRCRSPSPCHGSICQKSCCAKSQQSSSCSHLGSCDAAHCKHSLHCCCRDRREHSPVRDLHTGPLRQVEEYRVQPINRIENKKSLLNLTQPLNTLRLTPSRQKARNAAVTISESGEVCLEIFNVKDERIIDACRISNNGLRISIYKPDHQYRFVKDKPPPLPKSGNYEVYSFENLPPRYWKKYLYCAKFIQLVQAKTHKIIFYSSMAKNILMETGTDFESQFYKGGKIVKSLESMKIIDHCGRVTYVKGEEDVEKMGEDKLVMWKHFLMAEKHCKTLETTFNALESDTGECFYPVHMGKRQEPECNVKALGNSNKENVMPSLSSSPMISNMASYNGTIHSVGSNTSHMLANAEVPPRSCFKGCSRSSKESNALVLANVKKKVTTLEVIQIVDKEEGVKFVELSDKTWVTIEPEGYFLIENDGNFRYPLDLEKVPRKAREKIQVALHAVGR